ncbi:hypothetical protein [Agaribacter flavus]|uniref:Uncharacterized protein n=1 Tax=Agaribacter flavus TaxID=1902781 RepID=A0ABV7FQ37_9ALTE
MKSQLNKLLMLLPMILVTAIPASACEFHYGAPLGQLPQFHPLARQNFTKDAFEVVSLEHVKKTEVNAGEQATVKIAYKVPTSYRNVNISFSGSDETVEFISEPRISVDNTADTYYLTYTVDRPGTFKIAVQIYGFRGQTPFSTTQVIEVLAS